MPRARERDGGGFGRDGRRGFGGGFGFGLGGECVCSNCNYREVHELGIPYYNRKCPKCGSPLTRPF